MGEVLAAGTAGAVLLTVLPVDEARGEEFDAGHSGSGVLEQAAKASAEPAINQRDACVAMMCAGRSRYGAKTGAMGFVIGQ